MAAPGLRRAHQDVMKLMLSKYEVEVDEADGKTTVDFLVKNFRGPAGTPYEGGTFVLGVHLPADYPFKSPSIGFRTRVFHPNIDERSGSVCLDVINQSWSPMYDLINIFDVFLPQLLTYGNAADPLNGEAAALMLREPERFAARVKEYVRVYATPKGATPGSAAGSASTASAPSPLALGTTPAAAAAAAAAAGTSVAVAAGESAAPAAVTGATDDAASVASDVSEMSDL